MRDPKKPTTPKRPRNPGKKVKPENSPKPLLEPARKPKPRPETRPQPETKPKPKPEVKPDVRPAPIKPGSKPRPKPDTKPETRPEPKPKPELDTKPLANDIKPGKPGARQPLLLMPMRLEYRIVDSKVPPTVVHPSDLSGAMMDLRRKFSQTKPSDRKALQALEQERVALNEKYRAITPRLGPARLRSRTELWLRWYPDDNFAEAGTAPPSETETDALEAFLAHPQARYWPKLDDGTLLALWGELVAVAGPARAVHLFRQHDSEEMTGDWEARIGRIIGLPKQIGVFALHKDEIVLLGEGAPIPQNDDTAGLVSYAPDVLGDGAWMSDFDAAIDLGMGMKLADDRMVDLALEADWLICAGISDKDGRDDFSRLIQDRRDAGTFEILGQDTATNNAPGVSAGRDTGDTVRERLWDHTELELGALQQDGLDADLLAEALDIDATELKKAPGASESGHLDAAAMIRAIGPALMDGSLDATNQLNDVDDPDFIELLAQHVQARGILPAIKVGSGAYGVLPVLGTSGLQIADDTLNATEADYSRFVRNYANGVLTLLTERSDSATLRLEPDDPDASEKLTDILQTSRVSRRIDVSNMGASDIKGLDCPYRAKLSQLLDHVGVTHKGYPVQPGATADDKDAPDADVRDETLAPRAYHRGIFMARGSDIDGTTLSGLVIDEWVETRPSTQQDAAIALNYDSPQAEAPNSLLLCIAETGPRIPWSSTAAAGHVQSMLDLMKARALSTQTTPLSENVLPLANRVSHIGNGNNERPRIPQAAYKVKQAAWFAPPGQLTTVSASDLQKSPLRLNQIGPFRARPRTNQ